MFVSTHLTSPPLLPPPHPHLLDSPFYCLPLHSLRHSRNIFRSLFPRPVLLLGRPLDVLWAFSIEFLAKLRVSVIGRFSRPRSRLAPYLPPDLPYSESACVGASPAPDRLLISLCRCLGLPFFSRRTFLIPGCHMRECPWPPRWLPWPLFPSTVFFFLYALFPFDVYVLTVWGM